MRSRSYYRVRSVVRMCFWSSVIAGTAFLISDAVRRLHAYRCEPTAVVVSDYDTLWSIAERYCDGSIRSAVDDLISSRGTSIVTVGDVIRLDEVGD